MTGFKKTAIVVLLVGQGFTGTSQASLVARAGGMVYDDVHNITWAADANLFQTQVASNPNLVSQIIAGNGGVIHDTPNRYDTPANSGIHTLTTADFNTGTGGMTWWGAQAWANNLTLGGYTDWSLPTTIPDTYGWYNTASSQMGDLFYNQLGGVWQVDITKIHNSNYNLFANIQRYSYWSGSGYAFFPDGAWAFNPKYGNQGIPSKVYQCYAWAVSAQAMLPPFRYLVRFVCLVVA